MPVIGTTYAGVVTEIKPFGWMVKINATDTGLLHISEWDHGYHQAGGQHGMGRRFARALVGPPLSQLS